MISRGSIFDSASRFLGRRVQTHLVLDDRDLSLPPKGLNAVDTIRPMTEFSGYSWAGDGRHPSYGSAYIFCNRLDPLPHAPRVALYNQGYSPCSRLQLASGRDMHQRDFLATP